MFSSVKFAGKVQIKQIKFAGTEYKHIREMKYVDFHL